MHTWTRGPSGDRRGGHTEDAQERFQTDINPADHVTMVLSVPLPIHVGNDVFGLLRVLHCLDLKIHTFNMFCSLIGTIVRFSG